MRNSDQRPAAGSRLHVSRFTFHVLRAEWLLLAAILLMAAILRLGWPGLTEFKGDEARLLLLALEMAEGERFALRGISSSVGFPNFPMSVWLYALPLFIWQHVIAATLFTGLLNTLAVAACYTFVRRYWGWGAAAAAALMFAASPWAIIYSRKIWAQNLLALFVMGWAIAGALALVERRPRYLALHLLLLAVAIQIHFAAISLAVATLVLLILFRRRVALPWLAAGLLAAGLTAIPFAYYLASHDLRPIEALAAGGEGEAGLDLDALRYLTLISTGDQIHSLAGPQAFRAYLARIPAMAPVHWLWGGLILLGAGWLAWHVWRNWQRSRGAGEQGSSAFGQAPSHPRTPALPHQVEAGALVVIWLAASALTFLYHPTGLFPHYFIASFPAQYIAAGVTFAAAIGGLQRRWPEVGWSAAIGGWAALVGTAILQAGAWLILLFFVSERATPGAFGTPLALQLDAARQAQALMAEAGAAEILMAGPGDDPQSAEFPAVWDALLHDTPHRFVNLTHSALFPSHPAVVLIGAEMTGGLATFYTQVAWQAIPVPLRAGEGRIRLLLLPAGALPDADHAFEPPPLFANWVQLLGHDELALSGLETAIWRIYWRTGDNPDPADYHFFNHLLDANGQRISQADGPAFSPRQWRPGDTVISRFELPWPAEPDSPLLMRVGMYRYPSLENISLLDEAANPYADAVEIRLDAPD